MILFVHMIREFRRAVRLPGPLQFFFGDIDVQPESLVCGVANHQIAIIIKTGGTAAEGLGSVRIRKNVIDMAMTFYDCEGGVQGHPIDQVGHLAQPAAGSRIKTTIFQNHTFLISLEPSWFANGLPVGKNLAGGKGHAVQFFGGDPQVDDLVMLQIHIDVFQTSEQGGGVSKNCMAQSGLTLFGKGDAAKKPKKVPLPRIEIFTKPKPEE